MLVILLSLGVQRECSLHLGLTPVSPVEETNIGHAHVVSNETVLSGYEGTWFT